MYYYPIFIYLFTLHTFLGILRALSTVLGNSVMGVNISELSSALKRHEFYNNKEHCPLRSQLSCCVVSFTHGK